MGKSESNSEYTKLIGLLNCYEKILHPDLFNPIIKQVHATYEESKREAYVAAKISDEALWIENKLIELKNTSLKISKGNKIVDSFLLKNFYKKLLEKFNIAVK